MDLKQLIELLGDDFVEWFHSFSEGSPFVFWNRLPGTSYTAGRVSGNPLFRTFTTAADARNMAQAAMLDDYLKGTNVLKNSPIGYNPEIPLGQIHQTTNFGSDFFDDASRGFKPIPQASLGGMAGFDVNMMSGLMGGPQYQFPAQAIMGQIPENLGFFKEAFSGDRSFGDALSSSLKNSWDAVVNESYRPIPPPPSYKPDKVSSAAKRIATRRLPGSGSKVLKL